MRLPIYCPNVQWYLEDPKIYLPPKPVCLNNPDHAPCWNTHWIRGLILDHVHATGIPIFNAYCKPCHETISYWPVMVLPYRREPLETIEQVVVENLAGNSIRDSAARIGYDPRTVSRWIRLTFVQAFIVVFHVIRRILKLMPTILPLLAPDAGAATGLLLAWLHQFAVWIGYPHLDRLIGLCNLIGKGDWDILGAPLGRARSRVPEMHTPG